MLIKMQILKVNIRIPLPSPAIAVLGIIGLVWSALAMIQHRDRAVSLWLSAGLGWVILFWIIAEIVFPH